MTNTSRASGNKSQRAKDRAIDQQREVLIRLRRAVAQTPELPEAVNAADLRIAYNRLREAILSGLS